MLARISILAIFGLFLASCNENTGTKPGKARLTEEQSAFDVDAQQEFLLKLSEFCGKTFSGEEYFRSLHAQSWQAKNLSIHFKSCKPDEVKIDFTVDQNLPVTWILAAENRQLKLMHEHVDSTGELLPGSMYGGVATDQGTSFTQYFPADEYTGKIMEGAEENIWILTLAEDLSWLSYRLDRGSERRFEYRFDLRKE